MSRLLARLIKQADMLNARLQLKMRPRDEDVLVLYFHSVGLNRKSLLKVTAPGISIELQVLAEIIDCFYELGYRTVMPNELNDPCIPKKFLITFDDGYANNQQALPILSSYNACMVCFVSGRNVEFEEAFWWDVLWRERSRRHQSIDKYTVEKDMLKTLTSKQIRDYLLQNFGLEALKPLGEDDSPMTVKELQEFSRNKAIQIGNHTYDHEILVNLDSENELTTEITKNEQFLDRCQIVHVPAISYPNGNCSASVVAAARAAGMSWGFTTAANKYIGDNWTIGRFSISDDFPIRDQAIWCGADFKFYDTLRIIYQKCRVSRI